MTYVLRDFYYGSGWALDLHDESGCILVWLDSEGVNTHDESPGATQALRDVWADLASRIDAVLAQGDDLTEEQLRAWLRDQPLREQTKPGGPSGAPAGGGCRMSPPLSPSVARTSGGAVDEARIPLPRGPKQPV